MHICMSSQEFNSEKIPKWVDTLAKKEDIPQVSDFRKLLDDFKAEIIEPLKTELLGKVEGIESKVTNLGPRIDALEGEFKTAMELNERDHTSINERSSADSLFRKGNAKL